jgi:hypothetical protein
MKTVLRIISREKDIYQDIDSPFNIVPRVNDHLVFKEESYMVEWVEFDYDTGTVYIVCIEN